MVTYRLIPLLFSSINIGDELSAAEVTRGLGAPVKRTNVCEIGFHMTDFIILTVMIILTGLYLFYSLLSGVKIL
jgi:energy-coupling factor transport system permease protein